MKETIEFPVPVVAPGKDIHVALDETDQLQVLGAVMFTKPVPAVAGGKPQRRELEILREGDHLEQLAHLVLVEQHLRIGAFAQGRAALHVDSTARAHAGRLASARGGLWSTCIAAAFAGAHGESRRS